MTVASMHSRCLHRLSVKFELAFMIMNYSYDRLHAARLTAELEKCGRNVSHMPAGIDLSATACRCPQVKNDSAVCREWTSW